MTSLNLSSNPAIETANLSGTQIVSLNVSNISNLMSLTLDGSPIQTLTFGGNLGLTNVSLFGCDSLTSSLNIGTATTPVLSSLSMSNCNLSSSAIDDILIALDEIGRENGVVGLDGTNGIPSAAGLAAAANLIAKNWNVYINS